MIPLSAPLDDIDFDALVELARSRLPMLARDWTDYNYSDPGITLVELLAWIADTQIYSIGRNRLDERLAMAGLLGIQAEGARPAVGAVYPQAAISSPQTVRAGRRLVPTGSCAPRIEVDHEIALWNVIIAAIVSEGGAAGPIDHSSANRQRRASYAPFGAPPTKDAMLRLVLHGTLDDGPVALSLGFELEEDDDTGSEELGDIAIAYLGPDGAEIGIEAAYDSTLDLRRSGVIVVPLPAVAGRGGVHELRFRSTRAALIPRVLQIAPNALPVRQRATLTPEPFSGTGRAGQTIAIAPLSLFGPEEAAEGHVWRVAAAEGGGLAMKVEVQDGAVLRPWAPGDFAIAADRDEVYELDERADGSRIAIRFGNGVNGRRPPQGAQIRVTTSVSAGKGGNVAAGIEWLLDGARTLWRNHEPIDGGRDANDLEDLLARLRSKLRSDRPLATSTQIEEAARTLPKAFGVERAAVVDGWEPGRRRPAWPATRTLLVTRKGAPPGSEAEIETKDWLRAIGRRLRPRIALAERLIVATPAWRRLRVRVHAVAAPQRVPAEVAKEIASALAARLTPGGKLGRTWPLGQDVSAMAVGGWIRRLDGVAAVTKVTLIDDQGRDIADGLLELGRGELPRLIAEEDDVRVEPGARR